MRKDVLLPALALAGGGAGFLLRRWQLATAYLPETGLFVHGAPATLLLLALLGLMAVALLLLTKPAGAGPEDFLPAFRCPEKGQMAAFVSSWILLFAAGGFGMQEGFRSLRMWRLAPGTYQLSGVIAQLLAGALCILGGFGVLYMGRMAYRGKLNDWGCQLAAFPGLAGLIWLFSTHLKHGTEPVLMKYVLSITAALLLTLAHYDIAGFLFGKLHCWRTAFLALTGAMVGIASLADGLDLFSGAAVLGFSLSALAFARVLLRNTFGPPWPKRLEGRMPPPPTEEENQEE